MKYWPLFIAIVASLHLGGSALAPLPIEPVPQVQRPYNPVVRYAPWFDGITFDPSSFYQYYQERKFSDRDIWNIYLAADKFGGLVIVPQDIEQDALVGAALHWRQDLMQQLVDMKNPSQWQGWINEFSSSWAMKTQGMSEEDKKIFSLYLGTSPERLEHLWASQQQVSYATIVERINAAGQRSDRVPTSNAIVLGPSTPIQSSNGWGEMFFDLQDKPHKIPSSNARHAYQEFRASVTTYGLKGIKIPLGSIQNLGDLDSMHNNVSAFANALAMRTKMGPQALGLNSRLFWAMGASDQPLARAHIQQLNANTYLIHSPWDSVAHEWFHALTWTSATVNQYERFPWAGLPNKKWGRHMSWMDRQTIRSFWELKYSIQYARPKKSTMDVLMQQANHRTQQFLIQQWRYDPFKSQESFQVGSEQQAVQLSLKQFSSSYDAAVVATHMYWLNNPTKSTNYSTWVSRRMLMDRMLNKTGWSGSNSLNMKPGYFTEPEEWLAGSFQADMRVFTNVADADTSLMATPLPQEAQEYSKHWDRFFQQMGPWWVERHSNSQDPS